MRTGALWPALVLQEHEYWRMFTSLFLHSGILHIAFNMWALWVVGGFMEQVAGPDEVRASSTSSRGSPARCSSWWRRPTDSLVVGASGAIFGVFGALAVHAFLNRGRDFQSRSLLRQRALPAGDQPGLLVLTGGISWQAHIGGLIGGAATMVAMMLGGRKDPRRPFELADGLAVLGIVFVLVVITAWQVLTFTG